MKENRAATFKMETDAKQKPLLIKGARQVGKHIVYVHLERKL
ncbi:MAG: hypothetical protein ACLTJG_01665 [[Clostridium] innocuum]